MLPPSSLRSTKSVPSIGKAGHLQRVLVLVRPEPRNGIVDIVRAQHVARRHRPLVLGVPPGLEPDAPAAIQGMREGAAVAGREDIGIAGAQPVVDPDAVLDREARRSPARSRHRADAGDHGVADQHRPVRKITAVCSASASMPLDADAACGDRPPRRGGACATFSATSTGTPRIRMRGAISITVTGSHASRRSPRSRGR